MPGLTGSSRSRTKPEPGASGAPVELSLGQITEFEGGRVTWVRNYFTHADALKAAGLSEWTLTCV